MVASALEMERTTEATGWEFEKPMSLSDLERAMIRTWGRSETNWERGLCKVCGRSMPDAGEEIVASVCNACERVTQAHYDGEVASNPTGSGQMAKWHDDCPYLFREMVEGNLEPHYCDKAAYRKVTEWRPKAGHGMVLVGSSGTGKTLSLWGLKRNLMQEDIRCDLYSAVEIARELSRHAKDLEAAIHLWKTKVLMIDDLGKEPITTAASALFWELIDRRYQYRTPTVITTRFSGQLFTDRFKEHALGADIRRRIKDTCKIIQFQTEGES